MLARVGVSIAIIMYHTEAITLKELGIMSRTWHNVSYIKCQISTLPLPVYNSAHISKWVLKSGEKNGGVLIRIPLVFFFFKSNKKCIY